MGTREESLELKAQGNKYFASHEWLNAIDSYTKAIDLYGQDPLYYCNRAQVNMSNIYDICVVIVLTSLLPGQYQAGTIRLRYR